MSAITPTAVLVRNEDQFISNPVGEETIILNLATGDYLGLNPVGAFIWNTLQSPQSVDGIIARLMEAYTVDEETCRRQTLEYLQKMDGFGLLKTA